MGQFWNITSGIYTKYHVQFMLLLVLILQPEKFSHLTPCVYFRRVVLRRRENWFWSSWFPPSWSRHWPGQRTFSVFWFSEFSFKFLNLLISKSRLNLSAILCNSCDEIIWWFWVTIVTVIFTCRYFKIKLKYFCSQRFKWQEFLR